MNLRMMRNLIATLTMLGLAVAANAQSSPSGSTANAVSGSVQAVPATSKTMSLTLDDAIRLGIRNNLAIRLARDQQQAATAQKLRLFNVLLPNISLHAETGVHEYDLEALGFHPSSVALFAPLLPPGTSLSAFHLITKVDTTVAQVNFTQDLFNWGGYDVWRAAQAGEKAAFYSEQSALGLAVLNVGDTYLQAIAAQSQIAYARSLLKTDQTLLYQTHQEHLAGIVPNLDELRARVQVQQQQQAVIVAEDNLAKLKIALNREIGLAPQQPIQLTDTEPYSQLQPMTIEQALAEAYRDRQDYQRLKQELIIASRERSATAHERFPTLSFNGNWGVTGVTGGVYHDTFLAMGTLSIPIFEEGKLRGDRDVADAQLEEIRSRMADLTTRIDQQLRDSLLDLQTAEQTVSVAQSNVQLASTALDQTQQRFRAGITDNLPVAEAESTLAAAQTQYVNSVYQLNTARLGLARNLGIIDTQYKSFLEGQPASGGQ